MVNKIPRSLLPDSSVCQIVPSFPQKQESRNYYKAFDLSGFDQKDQTLDSRCHGNDGVGITAAPQLCHSSAGGNPEIITKHLTLLALIKKIKLWIPASAGMTMVVNCIAAKMTGLVLDSITEDDGVM